jgi:hypothetical protein
MQLLFATTVQNLLKLCHRSRSKTQSVNRGVRQHSFYLGTSRLNFAWLPAFFRQNRRVERFVDPISCFILGTILLLFLPLLGFWVLMSAACLRVFEGDVSEKEQNQNLDMVDNLIVSEIQSEIVEKFEEPPNHRQQRPESGVHVLFCGC